MTKFAKLFESADDQVLVVKSADQEGNPCINVSCLAITLVGNTEPEVVVNQLRYADQQTADVAFDTMDEARAREHAEFVKARLAEQLDMERVQLATRRDLS